MSERVIRTAGYLSPSWPPHLATNGIVSSLGKFRPSLQRLDVRVPVFAQRIDGSDRKLEADIVDLTAYQTQSIPTQLIERVRHRFQPVHCIANRIATTLLAAIRAQSDVNLDILELEETFGIAARIPLKVPFPVVVRLHGPWLLTGPLLGGLQKQNTNSDRLILEGKGLARARGISAPSRFVLESVIDHYSLDRRSTTVIPNPQRVCSPHERWLPHQPRNSSILFVGRFDPVKGGDIVIDAFSLLAKDDPDLQLYFIGSDDGIVDATGRRRQVRDYLKQRIDAFTLETRVKYLGVLKPSEVKDWRKRASLTVICSRYETFPNTALEAMSQGCPIVASDAGGIPEIIRDGISGMLFRSGQADDLARKCRTLLNNPGFSAELGNNAALECERKFDPDNIAEQTLDFYKSVTQSWRAQ